jgi:hypothetical protein
MANELQTKLDALTKQSAAIDAELAARGDLRKKWTDTFDAETSALTAKGNELRSMVAFAKQAVDAADTAAVTIATREKAVADREVAVAAREEAVGLKEVEVLPDVKPVA